MKESESVSMVFWFSNVLPDLQGQSPVCWKRTPPFLVNSQCSDHDPSLCQVLWIQKGCRSCLLLSGELNQGLAGAWQTFLRGFEFYSEVPSA